MHTAIPGARALRLALSLLTLLVLAGTLPACGPDASSAHDGESWPMSVEAPAVIDGPYDPSDLPDPDPAEEIIPTGYLVGEPVSSLLGP